MKSNFTNDQSGGVLIIFTILFTTTLIVGLFSLVADVGALYSERRVVQNGADAAALAVAQNCAVQSNGSDFCSSSIGPANLAKQLANLNSPDNLTASVVCGSLGLGSCGTLGTGKFECKPLSPAYKNFVRVKTSSEGRNGNVIESLFASNSDQTKVKSSVEGCAQAAWGKAKSAPVLLPFALPVCLHDNNNFGLTVTLREFSNSDSTGSDCTIKDIDGVTHLLSSPLNGTTLIQNIGCPGVGTSKMLTVYKTGDVEVDPSNTLNLPSNTVYRLTNLSDLSNSCEDRTGSNPCTGNCATLKFHNQMVSLLGREVFAPAIGGQLSTGNGSSLKFHILTFFSYKFVGACLNGDAIGSFPNSCSNNDIFLYLTYTKSIVPGADIFIPNSPSEDFPDIGAMAVQLLA